jgi:hypothetical protein
MSNYQVVRNGETIAEFGTLLELMKTWSKPGKYKFGDLAVKDGVVLAKKMSLEWEPKLDLEMCKLATDCRNAAQQGRRVNAKGKSK